MKQIEKQLLALDNIDRLQYKNHLQILIKKCCVKADIQRYEIIIQIINNINN